MNTSMNKRKTRKFPCMMGSIRKVRKTRKDLKFAMKFEKWIQPYFKNAVSIDSLQLLPCIAVLLVLVLGACTSNHYFSINAEEMTNPRIEYHDSTSVTNPF